MVLAGLDEPSVLLVVPILVGCNNKHLMFNYIIQARYHLWLKLTVIVNPMSCVSKNYSSAPSTASLAFIMIYTYVFIVIVHSQVQSDEVLFPIATKPGRLKIHITPREKPNVLKSS